MTDATFSPIECTLYAYEHPLFHLHWYYVHPPTIQYGTINTYKTTGVRSLLITISIRITRRNSMSVIEARTHSILTNMSVRLPVSFSLILTCANTRIFYIFIYGLRSSMAPRSVRFIMWSRKLSNVGWSLDKWPKIYYLAFFRDSKARKPLVPAAP
jgi:hypothetical protein